VLVNRQNQVRVTDFGLARAVSNTGLTMTNPTSEEVGYLAPEQIQKRTLSPRTDIYALGVMLFEMATGRLPFGNISAIAVALAHVEQEPPLPRVYNPNVSPNLELVIRRCLAKDPKRRYASALDLKASLRACLDDEQHLEMLNIQPEPTALLPVIKPGAKPEANEVLDNIISISLPPWMMNEVEQPAAEAPANRLDQPTTSLQTLGYQTNPAKPTAASYAPVGIISPTSPHQPSPTSVTTNRYKSKKQRWLVILLVGLLMLGLGLFAVAGFWLVGQARKPDVTQPEKQAATTPSAIPATNAIGQKLSVGGKLTGNTVWRLQDSPVLVAQDVTVDTGATLTIEPGVTVKLAKDVDLQINGGKLQAVGTAARPIVFTSDQATPKPGDWGGIVVQKNGQAVLSTIEIHFGGSANGPRFTEAKYPALLVQQGHLEMTTSQVTDNGGAGLIILGQSSGFVKNSTFKTNADYQVYLENKLVTLSNNQITGPKIKI
jgi:hypothetical protein